MRTKQILIAFLICLTVYFAGGVFLLFVNSTQTATHNQLKENSKSFAIDSVDYHQAGKDNNLQVTPYWMYDFETGYDRRLKYVTHYQPILKPDLPLY